MVADDLFNAAKAATKARRQEKGKAVHRRKDITASSLAVVPDPVPEEDKIDSKVLETPTMTATRGLKRKSRAAAAAANDYRDEPEDSNQMENPSVEDSLEASINDNRPQILKRATRSAAAAPPARMHLQANSEVSSNSNQSSEIDASIPVPDMEALKISKKTAAARNKMKYMKELEKIQRAPTPVVQVDSNDDLRKADKPTRVSEMEDQDFSFHPNVESTRVGLQQFDEDGDDEESDAPVPEPQGSPKASSRKRLSSRLKSADAAKYALVNEDDRGSYIERSAANASNNESIVKKSAQRRASKSVSFVETAEVSKSSRAEKTLERTQNTRSASIPNVEPMEEEQVPEEGDGNQEQITDDEAADEDEIHVRNARTSMELMPPPNLPLIGGAKKQSTKVTRKKADPEVKRMKDLVNKFETITGLKLEKEAHPTLVEVYDELMDEAMARLRHQTNGLTPRLGDWKDLLIHYGFIPEDDHQNRHLNVILRRYLDEEHLMRLINLPMLDGTGRDTIKNDIWNERAAEMDDDLPPLKIYGGKKRKRSRNKSNK